MPSNIRKRKDGIWESRIQIGNKRKSFYGTTSKEVNNKLTKAKNNIIEGVDIDIKSIKFQELAEEWLATKEGEVTDGVIKTYGYALNHIYSKIGNELLREIEIKDIKKMYKDLQEVISTSYVVKTISTVVKQVFAYGVENKVLPNNPSSFKKNIHVIEKETPVWSEEEIKKFMSVIKRTDHQALFGILLFAFPRINEVLCLTWDDLDLEKGVMHISKTIKKDKNGKKIIGTTKTPNSIRRVRLTSHTLRTLSELKEEQHRSFANGETPMSELVFPNVDGNWQDSNNVRKRIFKKYLIEAGLDSNLTIHSLRHIGISLMLERGGNPIVVKQMSGHSKVSFLFDKYGHAMPNSQDAVIELVEDLDLVVHTEK